MKKISLLAFVLIAALMVALPSFACEDGNPYPVINTAIATGGNATIQKGAIDVDSNNLNFNTNTNLNTNLNSNTNHNTNMNMNSNINRNTNIGINKQSQGQSQGQLQGQSQNNFQVIAPNQEVNIETPDHMTMGTAPNALGGPELNFISPNERDVQTILPKFGVGKVLPLKETDHMVGVIYVKEGIKFKNLYTEVLKALRSKKVLGSNLPIRYQIREAASSKTWTTSGSASGNIIGPNFGSAITGGTGSIIPSMGRAKSSNLYTIVIVEVQQFK
ncbi:hypothetical protein A2Z67_00965 [Candidatus Woesebacteria bacterium RBG_13_36_22]|uniref:Uncharacterized protein n=1 Tax=Candidatus Woesebacteria bacterium RBG_13_36_22 TaxID=1802478 RepID=A0A1F7WZL9_9BACT|nr:MAG: hypothetical protein A2Z67_00965 [Candidatus Woesebacteria bacterium RBG_13_36_22]